MPKYRFVLFLSLIVVTAVVALACQSMPGRKEAAPLLPEAATPSPEVTRPGPTATPVYVQDKSSPELVKNAYERGEINYDQQMLYLVYSVFEPESLPIEYQSDVLHKDATPIILEVQRNWHQLKPDTRDKISNYIQPLQR